MMHIISLGAGVQSTTMALMAAHGEITPMPDCAIFADTQSEPRAVYKHLAWLQSGVLPFPIHVVTAGSLRAQIGKPRPHGKYAHQPIPAYVEGGGPLSRRCTRDFKIRPIIKQVRELLGINGRRAPSAPIATQWIGISTDEAMRIKPSFHNFIVNRWPLIEQKISRIDCLAWLQRYNYPRPPKSACTFCPFHSNAEWRNLKVNDPVGFADAVAIDVKIRELRSGGKSYLHRSGVPLDQVDLSTLEDHGQLNLFNNECEGMCGV
jgi:hypothetical protein